MPAKKQGLSDAERRFVDEYLIDHNGVRAYRVSHGENQSYHSACVCASRLLRKVKVRAEISAAEQAVRKRSRITAERVINEIAAVAFADIGDHVDYTADALPRMKTGRNVPGVARKALKKIKIKTRRLRTHGDDAVVEEVEEAEVELHSKMDALEKLSKHLGLFKDEAPLATLLKQLPDPLRRDVEQAIGLEPHGPPLEAIRDHAPAPADPTGGARACAPPDEGDGSGI